MKDSSLYLCPSICKSAFQKKYIKKANNKNTFHWKYKITEVKISIPI